MQEEFNFDKEAITEGINDLTEDELADLTKIIEKMQEVSQYTDPQELKARIELFLVNKKITQAEDEIVLEFRRQIQRYSETGQES